LDVACGTGIVTRLVAERFGNVGSIVGMDLNKGMLDVARANTPTTGIPIEWRQGDLCALPFPDDNFSAVLCNQGMQFVPDKSVALGEIRRVLMSGGRLAFAGWGEIHPHAKALADALRRHVSEEVATSSLSGYALSDAEAIRQLVDEAGFHATEIQELVMTRREAASADTILSFIARTPYAREVAAISEEGRQVIGQEVVNALQAYLEGDDFVIPQKIHLVQARTP
jgi:ubiquinone/menaquinone biosynthesis C-methylase UbiE